MIIMVSEVMNSKDILTLITTLKNIPALRAKGLHIVELDTRARFALVIKKESKQFFDSGLRSTF